MANGNAVFDQALQMSTPGFDSLLGVIQSETQRIAQSRQAVAQREAQMQQFEDQQEIKLQAQKEQTQARIEAQTDAEKELFRFKQQFKQQEPAFDPADLIEKANQKSDSIRSEFNDTLDTLNIGGPNVRPTINETTQTPSYYQTIENFSQDEDTATLDEQTFQNNLTQLQELSNFVNRVQKRKNNLPSSDQLPEDTKGNYITSDNAENFVNDVKNATYLEKLGMAQNIHKFNLPPEGLTEGADDGGDLSADQKDIKEIYSELTSKYSSITLPETLTQYNTSLPENLDLLNEASYNDVNQIKSTIDQAAKQGELEFTQTDLGKKFDNPEIEQVYNAITKYQELITKSARLPSAKFNPKDNLFSNNFGLTSIDPQSEDLSNMWVQRENLMSVEEEETFNVLDNMLNKDKRENLKSKYGRFE